MFLGLTLAVLRNVASFLLVLVLMPIRVECNFRWAKSRRSKKGSTKLRLSLERWADVEAAQQFRFDKALFLSMAWISFSRDMVVVGLVRHGWAGAHAFVFWALRCCWALLGESGALPQKGEATPHNSATKPPPNKQKEACRTTMIWPTWRRF